MHSVSLDMLQAARLTRPYLGTRRNAVVQYLGAQFTAAGGFCDRAGNPDLYYSVFGIDALLALAEPLPVQPLREYLAAFGAGEELDFVHLACLARCWARLPDAAIPAGVMQAVADRIEMFRTPDGGYNTVAGEPHGSVTGAYLAFAAHEDAQRELPRPREVLQSIEGLHAADGGYSNEPDMAAGTVPATGGALILQHRLGGNVDRKASDWLWQQASPAGGFTATPAAPVPDLLSTATAVFAARDLGRPSGCAEHVEDTVLMTEGVQTAAGGYAGHALDDHADCEYTYYALVILGCLMGDTGIVSTDFLT